MRDPKFTTKRGMLTGYALACGYIERREIGDSSVTLGGQGAGACYPYYVTVAGNSGIEFHECFDTLAQARNAYALNIKRLTLTPIPA